jgi:hypothetical protein
MPPATESSTAGKTIRRDATRSVALQNLTRRRTKTTVFLQRTRRSPVAFPNSIAGLKIFMSGSFRGALDFYFSALIAQSGGTLTIDFNDADYSLICARSGDCKGVAKSKRVSVEWLLNVQTAVQMQYVDDASHLPHVNNGKISNFHL